jgi:hypothetical protein
MLDQKGAFSFFRNFRDSIGVRDQVDFFAFRNRWATLLERLRWPLRFGIREIKSENPATTIARYKRTANKPMATKT